MRYTDNWLKAIRKSNKEKPRNKKHGMSKTRFYKIWTNLNRRCDDKNNNRWYRYGGSGIKCLWKNFEEFKNDMYDNYLKHVDDYGEKNTQIDRIDFNKNYCKKNCKWSTPKEQSNNRSDNKLIEFNGKKNTIPYWSKKLGIPYSTIYRRIRNGWTTERALMEPINVNKRNKLYANKS